MMRVYDFLVKLSENNEKEWFDLHKSSYLEVKSIFENFTSALISKISGFDDEIDPSRLGVKDCTYRIYRDVRFSADKSPYKHHMGAYVCKGGKKSPYAGYYFHMEPPDPYSGKREKENTGFCALYAGLYRPGSGVLRSIREEAAANGDSFLNAMKYARGFKADYGNSLTRLPSGYGNIPQKWQALVKLREYSLVKTFGVDYLDNSDLADKVASDFSVAREYIHLLNRAVAYALEENY